MRKDLSPILSTAKSTQGTWVEQQKGDQVERRACTFSSLGQPLCLDELPQLCSCTQLLGGLSCGLKLHSLLPTLSLFLSRPSPQDKNPWKKVSNEKLVLVLALGKATREGRKERGLFFSLPHLHR